MNDELRQEDAYDAIRRQGAMLQNLADACRSDEDRLREVEERPQDVLREHGIDVPVDVDLNVVLNTHDTFHLTMPPDPNAALDDEALMAVAGGKTSGTASSAGTVGSIPSTASSLASLGCASSQAVDTSNRPRSSGMTI